MDLNIFNVLDELEDMIDNSKRVLGKVLINEEALLEYIDKIRTLLPEEIHQAKWLSKERERLLQDAHQESERILAETQEEVKRMSDESEVARLPRNLQRRSSLRQSVCLWRLKAVQQIMLMTF